MVVATGAHLSAFAAGLIPEQKEVEGSPFPLVLLPASPADKQNKPLEGVAAVARSISEHKPWIESQLLRHGAVLLRGFPLASPSDFNEIVEAFGYDELPYIGGAAPRTNIVGRVFTSNESPPDQKIPFHHEMAQVPEFPLKLFFFCEIKPKQGGETPIVLSHIIYDRMRRAYPDFVDKLETSGLMYIRVLGEGDDPSSPIGRGWQSTFLTKHKDEAEKRAAKLGMKLEWLADGTVKTISGPLPAIKVDERRNRKVWFNSMVAAYTGWKDALNDPRKAVTFGDGSPLPEEAVLGCLSIFEEESVAIPWYPGDVLILDNIAVQHSRKAFESPRRVLAALCK